ncbi:hemerythrin domain-containing protein [Sphingomonas panacisoli]|uniref:Hemerythrin domain-containing protein n=1 Tax=Sphingomonas panacisoli TaxID=1813879 RepID=A0A5B8LF00_9SPHN|nr:hemerythrin domain-containing protein [Sphingomonas panacisoli]QDZ06788.1 hemerythrin domain-containing protein [Sphingomonas panacisoli]
MSLLDKVIAAVTPPESAEARLEARAKAMDMTKPNDWLSMILEHHQRIEALFAAVRAATTPEARRSALRRLAIMLTGHAIAEEAAIYPALAADKQLAHAELAYQEQSAAKMELGLLERLDPMSEDFLDKLGHIEGAVAHHVYSEEGTWFVELAKDLSPEDQALVTRRYREEFERYMSGDDL